MRDKLIWVYKKEILADLQYFMLLGAVVLFTFLRIPSLVEPDWYGDEGVYQVIGRAINAGRLLYRDIWDNKPPFLYLYYALVNGDLFLIRLLSLVFGALSIVVFYFVASALFQKRKIPVYSATYLFAVLFGLPLLEGNIANAENFMLLPILLSLFFILKLNAKSKTLVPVFAGLFLSMAFLTKIVAIFDLGAFLVILFILRYYSKTPKELLKQFLKDPLSFLSALKQEGLVVISFLTPILCVFLFFFFQGALGDFVNASFSQNIGYVGYGNQLIIPQGLLIIKLLALIAGVATIFFYKKKIGVASIVIYTWLIFSLFNAFFSGRPYTHYVLVFLPAFCLLVGLIFTARKLALFNILIVIFLITFMRTQFTYYTNLDGYYNNYLSFIMGKKSAISYQAFFDPHTPRNYEIANFIKSNAKKSDQVFILSDSSTIYFLADKLPPGRYIVEYHITSYKGGIEETKQALQKVKPRFIIATNADDKLTSYFLDTVSKQYIVPGAVIYER